MLASRRPVSLRQFCCGFSPALSGVEFLVNPGPLCSATVFLSYIGILISWSMIFLGLSALGDRTAQGIYVELLFRGDGRGTPLHVLRSLPAVSRGRRALDSKMFFLSSARLGAGRVSSLSISGQNRSIVRTLLTCSLFAFRNLLVFRLASSAAN